MNKDKSILSTFNENYCYNRHAYVDIKNKKGNSSAWLAARGGYLDVIKVLHEHGANLDSKNNMNVSCLMVAFRESRLNVVSWLMNRTF